MILSSTSDDEGDVDDRDSICQGGENTDGRSSCELTQTDSSRQSASNPSNTPRHEGEGAEREEHDGGGGVAAERCGRVVDVKRAAVDDTEKARRLIRGARAVVWRIDRTTMTTEVKNFIAWGEAPYASAAVFRKFWLLHRVEIGSREHFVGRMMT